MVNNFQVTACVVVTGNFGILSLLPHLCCEGLDGLTQCCEVHMTVEKAFF